MSAASYCRRANPAARDPHITVLLTAFGPFPGVPVNATMRLVPELARQASLAFPDARFVTDMLPTEWQAAPERVAALIEAIDPDLVLHFGVSSRARGFEIERRACNVLQVVPDAAGALPRANRVVMDGEHFVPTSLPVPHLVLALKRRGLPAFASRDAGGYLCNALLYHSLCLAPSRRQRRVGFVHIPASLARPAGANRGRSGACPLSWPQAMEGGLEIIAGCLGRTLPRRAARIRTRARAAATPQRRAPERATPAALPAPLERRADNEAAPGTAQ